MGGESSKLTPTQLSDLRQQSQFTETEIKKFYKGFMKRYPNGKLSKEELIQVYKEVFPNGDPIPFAVQMFWVYDTDNNGFMDFREFICGLALLANGTPKQKLSIIFQSYDVDGSGYISKWEFQSMAAAIYKAVDPIQNRENNDTTESFALANLLFERMDKNNDDNVSFEEFANAACNDPQIKALLG